MADAAVDGLGTTGTSHIRQAILFWWGPTEGPHRHTGREVTSRPSLPVMESPQGGEARTFAVRNRRPDDAAIDATRHGATPVHGVQRGTSGRK